MNLIHRTAFRLYDWGWRLALPWLKLNPRLAEGYQQRTLKEKLSETADLWIQAASVGESFLALQILKTFNIKTPIRILLTSNTRQGIDLLKTALPRLCKETSPLQVSVRYFPFDKPSIVSAAVAALRPKLMVLLETELWPGLLLALKTSNSKILIINGRMTEKSLKRYRLWPSIWQNLRPDEVMAISEDDADRFRRLFGPHGIHLMHNIKFDRMASPDSARPEQVQIASALPADCPFVVFASVRHEEEPAVKKIIQVVAENQPNTVIGLFPRHIQRSGFWQETLTQLNLKWVLRSKISGPVSAGTVVLWDTFGELMPAFALAHAAFIGGSLAPLGGQNFLEALIKGVKPVIGPSWENFKWIGQEIVEKGLLAIADDWHQAAVLLLQHMDEPQQRDAVINATRQFIKTRQGGTAQACRKIEAMLFGK